MSFELSPEESIFMDQILLDPDDDIPRLIYSDWLEDRGDPRGEFIRLQCQIEKLDPSTEEHCDTYWRCVELLEANEEHWVAGVSDQLDKWIFKRGFVEFVALSADRFLMHADQLLKQIPARSFELFEISSCVDELAASTHLLRVEGLSLDRSFSGSDTIQRLAVSENLANLKRLSLAHCSIGNQGISALAKAKHLFNLEFLDVDHNGISNDGIIEFCHSSNRMNLQVLFAESNRIRLTGARAMSFALQHLHVLKVSNNPLTPKGIETLKNIFGDRLVID